MPFTAAEKLDVFVGTADGCNCRKLVLELEGGAYPAISMLRPSISARHNTMHIHCAGSGTTPAQDLHRAGKSIQY